MQPDTSSENNVLTKWRCPAPKLAIKTLTFSILYGTQVLPFCSAYFNEDGYCALHWCLTTNCSWSHKTGHVVSCDPNHESHYKLLLYFFSVFSVKKSLVKNRSKILTTNCYFDFFDWILLPYKTRLLRFASARRHRGLQNHRVQRVYSGPQGLAFCSGNSDRDAAGCSLADPGPAKCVLPSKNMHHPCLSSPTKCFPSSIR